MEASQRNPVNIDPANVVSEFGIPLQYTQDALQVSHFADDNRLVKISLPVAGPRMIGEAYLKTGANGHLQSRLRDLTTRAQEMCSGGFPFVSSRIEFVWHICGRLKDVADDLVG